VPIAFTLEKGEQQKCSIGVVKAKVTKVNFSAASRYRKGRISVSDLVLASLDQILLMLKIYFYFSTKQASPTMHSLLLQSGFPQLTVTQKKNTWKASTCSRHKTKQAGLQGRQVDKSFRPAWFVLPLLLAPLFFQKNLIRVKKYTSLRYASLLTHSAL